MAQPTEGRVYKAECGSCTLMLVKLAYQRTPWFILFRTPLVMGMRLMAWWHNIDARRYPVGNPECKGCVRFMKNELKEKSPTFRWLNDRVNPVFNRWRDAAVTPEEKAAAKSFAAEVMKTTPPPDQGRPT